MKKLILMAVLAVVGFGSCNGAKKTNEEDNSKNHKMGNMKTIEITKADFLKKVVDYEGNPTEWKYLGDKPAIVDFYAEWCGPCKMIAPILSDLAKEYGDQIYIYKVDTDNEPELSAAFGIQSIPTLLFIPMEGEPQLANGAMSKADFKKAIDQVLLKK